MAENLAPSLSPQALSPQASAAISRRNKFKNMGIGLEFASGLLNQLSDLNKLSDSRRAINENTETAEFQLESEFNRLSQQDVTKALLAGLDVNEGSIASLAASRGEVLAREQQRIRDSRGKALDSLDFKENLSFFENLAAVGVGVLGWLLL